MLTPLLCSYLVHSSAVQNPSVVVKVHKRGSFVISLNYDESPRTVSHFLNLIDEKFYHGILWHRKVPNFVLQTGDPVSKNWVTEEARQSPDGAGGTKGLGEEAYGPTVKFEKNNLKHDKMTIGMALESPGDDSGSSHFFINLQDNHRLNGKYVVFGKVTSGWDVVEKCQRGDLILSISRAVID